MPARPYRSAYTVAATTLDRWTQPIALGPNARRALLKDLRVVRKAVDAQALELERVKAAKAKLALEYARENRKLETALRNLSAAYASTKGKRQ